MADNNKDGVDVPVYLDKANYPGPFTAGVKLKWIPYEFFGGDGMLTRLIRRHQTRPMVRQRGSAKIPAPPTSEKLSKGLYFYEDLAGTQGKSTKTYLTSWKQKNGTQSHKATIKVYGAKDGKADLSNLVATKDLMSIFEWLSHSSLKYKRCG